MNNQYLVVSSTIVGGFLLDIGIPFLSNPKYSLDSWNENIEDLDLMRDKSRHRESIAGRLSGLVFGGISIIITVSTLPSGSVEDFRGSLLLLAMALAFFLFSILIGRLFLYRRLWYTIQDKSIIYGLLSVFVGVVTLYISILSIPFYVAWITLGILFTFRAFDFKYDFLSGFNMWQLTEESSEYCRIGYIFARLGIWWDKKCGVFTSRGLRGFIYYDTHDLQELSNIGDYKAESLQNSGYPSVSSIENATVEELTEVPGIGENLAEEIKDDASRILQSE